MTFIYLLAIPLIAAVIGYALGYAAIHLKVEGDPLAEQINALLPNGQCGQCGFPGCMEAAKAMASQSAAPTICAPGGSALAKKIADIVGVSLDDSDDAGPRVAAIDMSLCDGCGRCIKQCMFDAIVGANRQLHGVIAEACTGCGACTNICPHHGIRLYPDPTMIIHIQKPLSAESYEMAKLGVLHHA